MEKDTKDTPYFDEKEGKWKNYKPIKGQTPPWDPFNPEKRKKRVTMRERKFLAVLSTTSDIQGSYRAAYKVKPGPTKQLERARVQALANQVLNRLRKKVPELVKQFLFEDITPETVRRGILDLNRRAKEDNDKHIEAKTWDMMGRIFGMFTEKHVVEEKIKDTIEEIYQETDKDFPNSDERINRHEFEKERSGVA